MEPLFNESKNRLMVKIAELADKGEAADSLEYVGHVYCVHSTPVKHDPSCDARVVA